MDQNDLKVKIHFEGNYVKFNKYHLATNYQIIDSEKEK